MRRSWGGRVLVLAVLLTACTGSSAPTTEPSRTLPPETAPATPETTPPSDSTTLPTTTTDTTRERPRSRTRTGPSGDCITTPGALQAIIDAAPDGSNVQDMKGKLVDAAALGFSVIDLSRDCYADQGEVTLEGRYGLWIVAPTTVDTDWRLIDTDKLVLSGATITGGSLTIVGGNQRIEAGQVEELMISNVTDLQMGKMTVTGHTQFDNLAQVDSDKSFARNCAFNTVELSGTMSGFKIENSTAASIVDDTASGSDLNVNGLNVG